ncbi:tetratricopeptide repeat protein [Chloroflexota bacterium]
MNDDHSTESTPLYNLATIRNLLREAFTADDLRRFCQDRPTFRPILDYFGPGFNFMQMVDAVIEQCRTWALLPDLLAGIQEVNPRQYERYRDQLLTVGGRQRVVNPRLLDMTHTFKNRDREVQLLREYLADERVRLISVVGRGGWGKTALVCHVLADLEQGTLPIPGEGRGLAVDGILYLSARSTSLSLERIHVDVQRMLGEPAASRLAARWRHGDASSIARVGYLLEALQDGVYLLLLDNLEDHLTKEGEITDDGLSVFLQRFLTQPSGVRLIVTSRWEPRLPSTALPRACTISLEKGLPDDDASSLLHELDPQSRLGLRDASEEDLQLTTQRTQGIPRALELVAGILKNDPTMSLPRLLADERLFGEEVVEELVAEGYLRLRDDDGRVMEALAVFDRPVEETAVTYLLQPWFPELDVRAALQRLVNSYFVGARDRNGIYSLHPLDREHVYGQLRRSVDEPDAYSQRNLELRAAGWYVKQYRPKDEWHTMEDLAPQLAGFEHRIRAEDYDNAGLLLESIDFDYLFMWGYASKLVELRETLLGHLKDPNLKTSNWGSLGNAYRALGKIEQASGCYGKALDIAHAIHDSRREAIWLGRLGSLLRTQGQIEQAIEKYQEALNIAREIGDHSLQSTQLAGFGAAYRALGKYELSIEFQQQALAIAQKIKDSGAEAASLISLGLAYGVQGQGKEAIEHFNKALGITRQLGHRRREASCLMGLGLAHRALGQISLAVEYHEQALTLTRRIGLSRGEGAALGHLGDAYRALGQALQAKAFFEKAQTIACRINDLWHKGIWLSNLGRMYVGLQQPEKAIELYEEALTLARSIGDRQGESYRLVGLSRALLMIGMHSEARGHCKDALKLNLPDTGYRAAVLLGTALLYLHDPIAPQVFEDATTRCQDMLDKTADFYEPRYALAAALSGQAACNPYWVDESKRAELLAPALVECQRALGICAAPGVIQDVLCDLELIRAAGIKGLEPVFELFESA